MRSPKAAPDAARAPRLDRPSFGQRLLADIRKNWILYVMVLPVLGIIFCFRMYRWPVSSWPSKNT